MRRRAEKIMIGWGSSNHPYPAKEFAKHMADNMQICSCYCCGNPRKYFDELTVQERRYGVSTQAALEDGALRGCENYLRAY